MGGGVRGGGGAAGHGESRGIFERRKLSVGRKRRIISRRNSFFVFVISLFKQYMQATVSSMHNLDSE